MTHPESQQSLDDMYNGICSATFYEDGSVSSLRLCEKNLVMTHTGQLVPYYSEDSPRRKYKASMTFYPGNLLKSVSLDKQQEVITPIGELPAELVTFYDTGELKRVFPLDGKISGYWSEDDERKLNFPLSFEFDFTAFSAMLTGICFYKNGSIRSITLFPDEIIPVSLGGTEKIDVRQGFSLYENGALASLEPAAPVRLQTPIGYLSAYDPNANGVNADSNSLRLDERGNIVSLITAGDKIAAFRKGGGASVTFAPKVVYAGDEPAELRTLGIRFDYEERAVTITDPDGFDHNFTFDDTFVVYNGVAPDNSCSGGDCSSCSLCGT